MDEDFLRELTRLAPVLLFTADSRGFVQFVNDRWLEVTGAPADELLGDGWTNFVHPEDLERLRPVWRETVRRGRPYAQHWRFRNSDGSYRWFEIRAEPERNGRGEIVRWIGSGSDIDRVRRAAVEMRKAYEREHRVAMMFQEAALPLRLPKVSGFRFDAIYEAGRAEALVGGDWYDGFVLADGRIVISMGDVAGSGLHAAVRMASVRQAIRGVAHVRADPALMLAAAGRALQNEDPEGYVTAFAGVIDPIAATLTHANAGHPPPFVRLPNGYIESFEGATPPLGVTDGSEIETLTCEFLPGSMMVLYTDGLVESTHDVLDGYKKLRAALSNPAIFRASRPAAALKKALLQERSRDDVAILVIESVARAAPRRWAFDARDPDDSRRVRAQVIETLRKGGYPDERITSAELILAELTANVFRYAAGPSQIVLEWNGENPPVLHVIDLGPGFQFEAKLPADVYSETGRGLYLISTLASDLQVSQRNSGGSHARVVLRQ